MASLKRDGQAPITGFLNLYKPPGLTSMEALRRVKRITGQRRKVGHGGTIDPLAQGVLPVCLGQATRLMDYLVERPKRYQMEVKLGITTTTYDAEGEVVRTRPLGDLTLDMLESKVQAFVGLVEQTPPMYSAIKFQGQRLYNLARAGIEVERKTRPVEVYSIRVVSWTSPTLVLDVESGRGAYMRTLAHDLGESLGCGGHVANLVRLSCGGFNSEDAVTLERLEEASQESSGWEQYLYTIDSVLRDLKCVSVGPQAEHHLRHGRSVNLGRPEPGAGYLELFRAYSSAGQFLALVRLDRPANSWKPVKVFQMDRPSPYAPAAPLT